MIIYHNTKGNFVNDVMDGVIADKLEEEFIKHGINHNNAGEHAAWANSLHFMKDILDDDGIDDDCDVAVEYQIPISSRRVDFLIAGKDENDKTNVVVVELKQWTDSTETDRRDVVYAYTGHSMKYVPHPSYQAYSYAKTIENFNETVSNYDVSVIPCAYLHNYAEQNRSHIDNEFYKEAITLSPIFLQRDSKKLNSFIKKFVRKKDGEDILYKIDEGKLKPTKSLQDALSSMLKGNPEFELLDEQKVAFETIKNSVINGFKNLRTLKQKTQKITYIIKGGPGTGKSIIAISLLVYLINKGYSAIYVTKNQTPRDIYSEELIRDDYSKKYIKSLFLGPSRLYLCGINKFDCILCDESHRLTTKSRYEKNAVNQIKEIIHASLISVFFIDEDQKVTTSDIGSVDEIKRWAADENSLVIEDESLNLVSQFRCNGCEEYIDFVDTLLGFKKVDDYVFKNGMSYELRLFNSPSKMREELRKKNVNNKARMLAGYCYNWISKKDDHKGDFDINLEDNFHAQWNLNENSTIWAIKSDSFEQVGCIHTSQGIELHYVGVIIGKDLYFSNGDVKTNYEARAQTDKSLSGVKSMPLAEAARISNPLIRNTYKVLLTRAQKGTYIYCEDKKLLKHISDMTGIPIEY